MNGRRKFLKNLASLAAIPALSLKELKIGTHVAEKSFRVMSCNIRVALDEDEKKGVGWSSRKNICLKIIESKKPDIICLQEVLRVQADDFRKHFSSYQLFGFDGPEMDVHPTGYHGIAKNPILYSKARYELLSGGAYWLSETPLIAGSKSWDTARARNMCWVRLKDKISGKQLRVVNLHLDHVSAQAKTEQLKLVVEESAQYLPEFNQIMAGDFNSRYQSKVLESARKGGWKESYETIHGEKEAGFTVHEFQGLNYEKGPSKGRIDYIWYRGKIKPLATTIVKDHINGKYPSDHFFLQSDFIME